MPRLTDAELAEIRRRRPGVRASLACEGMYLTPEEEALFDQMDTERLSPDEAVQRMQVENPNLSEEQARHLTIHGVNQNEDGTFSWKFDNYTHGMYPVDVGQEDLHRLWGNIACPTLLVNGAESWASNPAEDGRLTHFRNAQVKVFEGAGHWVQHDKLDEFLTEVRTFI